jgi:threonine synthase
MSAVRSLTCRECGADYPQQPVHVCEACFGPLEVRYDYDTIRRSISREIVSKRPHNLWRYRELLPIDGTPLAGLHSGWTPLVRADRLAAALGVEELYVKDDSVNHPTFSYKDRVVSVAITKALEFGFDTVSCASTGNLANAVSAHAARAGLECFIFIPEDLEPAKVIGSTIYRPRTIAVRGNYDDVNRLCSEIVDRYAWAFVNINLRPFYAEGAKTFAFEIAEQLGWRAPRHIVVPTAGGTILPRILKGFRELEHVGLMTPHEVSVHCAQATGCAPVVHAIRSGSDVIRPVKPHTIARSIAIGNPADGHEVVSAVRESDGWAESATDEEIVEGIALLARTEGILTEPAGGTTVAVTRKLIEQGRIGRDASIVVSITGNGYKTLDAIAGETDQPFVISARLQEFDELYNGIVCSERQRVAGA